MIVTSFAEIDGPTTSINKQQKFESKSIITNRQIYILMTVIPQNVQ